MQKDDPRYLRGARSFVQGRFESVAREVFDDGWTPDEPDTRELKTFVTIESARSIISHNDSPDVGFSQSINPYRGCEHGCIYCYARPSHAYLELSPGLDFETRLFAKTNAAERLREELAKPGYQPSTIALGANTDCYQPIERKYRITRQILEVLAECEHPVSIAAVVTAVRRQISKKTGKEYARLVLEDFQGTAEAIVFPEAWAKLNQTIAPDTAMLLIGGYSQRDRDEERAPFVVESARPLGELRSSGQIGLSLRWGAPAAPGADTLQAAAALCRAHPGPVPIYIDWSDGNGEAVRLRSRRVRVAAEEELLRALRDLLGSDAVHYVKAG